MTIKTDMRELIKEESKEGVINKKTIFEKINGSEEDKQNALIQMLEDGEIFEARPQEFRWLGA